MPMNRVETVTAEGPGPTYRRSPNTPSTHGNLRNQHNLWDTTKDKGPRQYSQAGPPFLSTVGSNRR
jgi:hypothetical protein